MRILKFTLALLLLLAAGALLRFAMEWRAPFLPALRSIMFGSTIAVSFVLIAAQLWLGSVSRSEHPLLRWLTSTGVVVATLALGVTLFIEAQFQWTRHQVLHGDPGQLERLGRHLMVGYDNLRELRNLVKLRSVAGVFVSKRNVEGKSISRVRSDIDDLQRIRAQQGLPPLWIATDQEGGIVSRLSPPLSRLPALSELVEQYSDVPQRERAVKEFGFKQGRELAEIGVNLNFAPVVDVNHKVVNPDDRYTRIFQRAISDDPKVVAQVATWYCHALAENGVACTLKHFPGLGRVFEDTHFDPASLSAPLEELNNTDWIPFRKLMQTDEAWVMLGHARLTALDAQNPVSMSWRVIAGLLRGTWRYDGVLITDNFSMMAVFRSPKGMAEGGVAALNAGVDLILISYDPDQYYQVMYALLVADEQGKLDEEALRQSDQRLQRARTLLTERRNANSNRMNAALK